MTINGWDVSNAHARQWTVKKGYEAISNASAWPAGGYSPIFIPSQHGFKPLDVTLLIKGNSRADIQEDIGTILTKLDAAAELALDGWQTTFKGVLKSFTAKEDSLRRFHTLSLHFEGIEYGAAVSRDKWDAYDDNPMTLTNPGNAPSPADVYISCGYGPSGPEYVLQPGDIVSFRIDDEEYTYTEADVATHSSTMGILGMSGGTTRNVIGYKVPIIQPGTQAIWMSAIPSPLASWNIRVDYRPRYR